MRSVDFRAEYTCIRVSLKAVATPIAYGNPVTHTSSTQAKCWISFGIAIDTIWAYSEYCSSTSGRTLAGGSIEWWDGSGWVADGTVSGQINDWTYELSAPVTTTALRIYGVHAATEGDQDFNPMIFEWGVSSCAWDDPDGGVMDGGTMDGGTK